MSSSRGHKQLSQYLLLVLTTAIVSACTGNTTNQTQPTDSQSASSNCRMVDHNLGETCVPNNPQRIVSIYFSITSNVLALDVKPVGSPLSYDNLDLTSSYLSTESYLGNKTEGINNVGESTAPSLEKIASLNPDLIISINSHNFQAIYPQLAQIAPTVATDGAVSEQWQYFDFVAEVLDKEDAATRVKDDYYQRVERLKSALSDRYQNKEISVVGGNNINDLYAYTRNIFPGYILDDLALKRPQAQNISDPAVIHNISQETLDILDGDLIFFLAFGDGSRAAFEELQQVPLWQDLKAVRENQVYLVEGDPWIDASPLAAHAVLDDIEKHLINDQK